MNFFDRFFNKKNLSPLLPGEAQDRTALESDLLPVYGHHPHTAHMRRCGEVSRRGLWDKAKAAHRQWSGLSLPSCLKMHSTSDRRALRYARREGWEVCYPQNKYRRFSIISTNQTPKFVFPLPSGMRFWRAAARTQKTSSPSALTIARSRRPAARTQKASSPSA